MRRLLRHLLLALGYGLIGGLIIIVGGYLYLLSLRPELAVWHRAELDAEFARAHQPPRVQALDDYRRLEDRLFRQLQEQVHERIASEDRRQLNRYHAGSLTDPDRHPRNWNRTFELIPEQPLAGALLLHGLSDSPYSMRALAEALHARDVRVVGLRLPGHGTAPSGLLDVTWQDFAAAVRIAMHHLHARIGPDKPLYLIGYSNGAALAVEYALSMLEGSAIPEVDRLVLLSPAIGVSPVAALAIWQARLAEFIGQEHLAWNAIEPEFDPYKYNSFTVNAGDQVYRLTRDIAERLERLAGGARVEGFPPTLGFLSVVDATITVPAVVEGLFGRLAPNGHELVLFDINRFAEAEPLLSKDPAPQLEELLASPRLPFTLTLVTNAGPLTRRLEARTRPADGAEVIRDGLALRWPRDVFSLSHVALPFPPDDPVYGGQPDARGGDWGIALGAVSIRGERGLLEIADSHFLRLRYNPFHAYLVDRLLAFLALDGETTRQAGR